jgi:hypothetical protein
MRVDSPAADPLKAAYEPCEQCGAPLDPQQRYCVHCATRRGNGANPASRYFAAMGKRTRKPVPTAGAKPASGSRAAAVAFFALLPVAVGIGVVVGRGNSNGSEEALLEALRKQQSAASTVAQTATAGSAAVAESKTKKGGASGKGKEKVLAKTDYGNVHEVTHFQPSEKKVTEDTKLVENNVEQTGDDYVKAQTNLPDVVVVGGDPSSAPALPTAGNQP